MRPSRRGNLEKLPCREKASESTSCCSTKGERGGPGLAERTDSERRVGWTGETNAMERDLHILKS